MAPKPSTIGINKTKGDHDVRGAILSCLGQWKGKRIERQVKAMLQATRAAGEPRERPRADEGPPGTRRLGKLSILVGLRPSLLAL